MFSSGMLWILAICKHTLVDSSRLTTLVQNGSSGRRSRAAVKGHKKLLRC